MKYFYQISKLILYCIIGGILGFIVMFMGSYMKATSIAGDIARSGLLLATQDGCINSGTAEAFCQQMHKAYGYDAATQRNTRSILVSNTIKTLTGDDVDEPTTWNFYIERNSVNNSHFGLISVHPAGNNTINLINGATDYERHVQRGEAITVYATVEANMYFNWVFGANANYSATHGGSGDGRNELRFTFPVNASATGVSCKWYKGEVLP